MDPNSNSIPTPNPTPEPSPVSTPGVTSEAGVNPMNPVNPATNATPINAGVNSTPVQATAAGGMTTAPVNPVITPMGANRIEATEPILRPEPAPAPDPVKEELNAPMVAAAPVPGSIGSAVSSPAAATNEPAGMANGGFMNERRTPSVAFNDPAVQPDPTMQNQAQTPAATKTKKSNKAVLITLIVVALAIVAVLVVMLVMQLMSDTGSTSASTPNTPVAVDVDDDEEEAKDAEDTTDGSDATDGSTTAATTVACYRAMTAAELAVYTGATSGTINLKGNYDADDALVSVKKTEVVLKEGAVDPSEEKSLTALASEVTADTAAEYYLTVDKEGGVDLTLGGMRLNWTELGFTCE